jgi:hypothetical protein
MVKKRMAMRMVTIFVALIVCGMFFPGLARGAGTSIDTELDPGATDVVVFNEDIGEVLVGEVKSTFVGITNTSESDGGLTIFLALNRGAECPQEYFGYIGPDGTPEDLVATFNKGETLTVEVTFSPSEPVDLCTAFLQITPIAPAGNGVRINFTAKGVEKTSDDFGPIVMGGFTTSVMDRLIIDEHTNCTLSEMIDECMDKYNGVRLMRSIAWTTGELYSEGLITRQEKNELRRTAAKLTWRRMFQEMKKRRSSKGSTKLRRFWWCRDN